LTKERDDNLEKLTSTVQKMLDGNPAILIGSGGSIPYGLPSMSDLADEIKSKLQTKYENDEQWKSFISALERSKNLELAVEKIIIIILVTHCPHVIMFIQPGK